MHTLLFIVGILLLLFSLCMLYTYVKVRTIKFPKRDQQQSVKKYIRFYFSRVNDKLFLINIGQYVFTSNPEEALRILDKAEVLGQ